MTLLGLDLNASRARAVQGRAAEYALALPLDPPALELPLVVSLAGAQPEVGAPGLRLTRLLPHLTCQNFLANVGKNGQAVSPEPFALPSSPAPRHAEEPPRCWQLGMRRPEAEQALALVWQRLRPACQAAAGVVLALPGYLARAQVDQVRRLGDEQHVRILGTLPSLMAAALAGYADQHWGSAALVLDVDEHALSFGLVRALDGQAHLLETRHFPALGLPAWKDRLINALADCCVLQSRRDPRDVPVAEQALYEQLDALLDAGLHQRTIQLGIQGTHWYQNLLLAPEQTAAFCGALLRRLMKELHALWDNLSPDDLPSVLLLTNAAARLPGLLDRLRLFMDEHSPVSKSRARATRLGEEDFGEGLLDGANVEYPSVTVLPPDAVARGAHGIAGHFTRGQVPGNHLELVAPLPLPQPADMGPPRLSFEGQEILLDEPNFIVGSQPGCHLHVDSRLHPSVAPRHCEIVFDHRTYVLFNRSRAGTLVNDQPVHGSVVLHAGDLIRLGADGPQIRFVGQAEGVRA